MALRETCCFYANQSGIIRENPAMVRESGKKKKNIDQIIGIGLCLPGPRG